jgi:hypothetical protein
MCNVKSWIRRLRNLVELYADYKAEALTFGVGRSIFLPNKLFISYEATVLNRLHTIILRTFCPKSFFGKRPLAGRLTSELT